MARQWRRNSDARDAGNHRHDVNLSQPLAGLAVKHPAPRSPSPVDSSLSPCCEIPLQLRTGSVDKAVHDSMDFEKFSRMTIFCRFD